MLIVFSSPNLFVNHVLVVHQAHTADPDATRLTALALLPILLLPRPLGLPQLYSLHVLLHPRVAVLLQLRRSPLMLDVDTYSTPVLVV